VLSEFDLRREFVHARFLIIPGHYDFFGGAERQSLILAKALIEDYRCNVDFLGWGGDGALADKVRDLGIKPWVFNLPAPKNRLKVAVSLQSLATMIRNEIQPDYLLPFVSYHSKIIGSIWRHTGARFTWWNQRDEGRLVYGTRTERRLMRTLPSIVSNSLTGRDFLINKFNLPVERVRVINNGVSLPDEKIDSEWRARLGLDEGNILITMVASLTKYKDHDTLLKAFAIARNSVIGSKLKLVLAGRMGDTSTELKALAFDLGLSDSVAMVGEISDVDGLLSVSDLVVHSSVYEGCPNAVLEAMAHRRCVVGTDIPGLRQALGESAVGNYLARPFDAEELARLIVRFANSPNERARAGKRNRVRIESEFSISGMTSQVLQNILDHRVKA
jgi:glycosyltransferase involved in cell wall biosynthesis